MSNAAQAAPPAPKKKDAILADPECNKKNYIVQHGRGVKYYN